MSVEPTEIEELRGRVLGIIGAYGMGDSVDPRRVYLKSAELLRDGEFHGAIQIRTESLELDGTKYQRMRPDLLPDTYLVGLARRVQELRDAAWTVVEIGDRRKVDDLSLRTLNRRLTEAKHRDPR